MLPRFPYSGMTITGVMHVIIGVGILILTISIIGTKKQEFFFEENDTQNTVYGALFVCSLWTIMVGILGILAGVKYEQHGTTRRLKVAYMVTAILSAVIFSNSIMAISVTIYQLSRHVYGILLTISGIAEFILSIVSSSICCCCAESNPNPVNVVVVQGPPGASPSGQGPPINNYPQSYPYTTGQYPVQSPQEGFTNPSYQIACIPPSGN